MVNVEELRKRYAEAVGYEVFLEEGEAIDFYRQGNHIEKPIFGVFSANPVSMTAIRAPFIGVLTVDVTMLAPPDRWEEVSTKMNVVATVLNGTSFTVKHVADKEDQYDTTYTVSYNCQSSSVGDRILDAAIGCGEVFPITQTITYVIVENGVSAYDARLWIDGLEVSVLTLVENKIHTTSVYPSDIGDGCTASEMESYGIDFTTPYTNGEASNLFRSALNDRSGNNAHCVVIEKAGKKSCRLMQFASVSNSISPPQNIGFNVSMTEIASAAADFNGYWLLKNTTGGIARLYLEDMIDAESTIRGVTVFWGDGTSEDFDEMNRSVYHVFTDGLDSHQVIVFKKYADTYVSPYAGMNFDSYGKKIHVVTEDGGILTAKAIGKLTSLLNNGEDGANKRLILVNNSFEIQQQIGNDSIPFGFYDESNGWYLKDGMTFQTVLDKIANVGDKGAKYFRIAREDLPPQVEE
jgi:hypothetical protein